MTYGLTSKKPGSAPCPTLLIEYGTTLLTSDNGTSVAISIADIWRWQHASSAEDCAVRNQLSTRVNKQGKVVPCLINEHWARSRPRSVGSQPTGDLVISCHYFPPDWQLRFQLKMIMLVGRYQIILLGDRRTRV